MSDPDSPHTVVYERLSDSPPDTAVSVILKLRGETCDIDCLYCYEKRKEAPGGATVDVADLQKLGSLFRNRLLAIELHGGEPLTAGREYMHEILSALALIPNVIRVSLQTNGVRLDEEWLDLFDETYPALTIGISLDGDGKGNSWRVGYDGKPVYAAVVSALNLLASRSRKVGVIAAVTPHVLGRSDEVFGSLLQFEAVNSISFVPCFDGSISKPTAVTSARVPMSRIMQRESLTASGAPAWAITPAEYAQFVLECSNYWVATGAHRRVKLEPTVSAIRKLRGLDTGFCHFSSLKCDHVFTLYPGGRFGSCDELPWPRAQLGQLDTIGTESGLADIQTESPLLRASHGLAAKCTDCAYRSTCGGGCIASRLRAVEAIGDDDAYCQYRMRLIDGVAALIAAPAHAGGVWCEWIHARPRHPNTMRNVQEFIDRWDDPHAVRPPLRLTTSLYGNINVAGLGGVHEADDADPSHPQWENSIEPGAWPLVDVITRQHGLITYDSCEGHSYPQPGLDFAERRVGILPRNDSEYAAITTMLCGVAQKAAGADSVAVTLTMGRSELICEASGDRHSVVDLLFERRAGTDWSAYFADVNDLTREVAEAIRSAPFGAAQCECSRHTADVSASSL